LAGMFFFYFFLSYFPFLVFISFSLLEGTTIFLFPLENTK
jgi:hypothetical protein